MNARLCRPSLLFAITTVLLGAAACEDDPLPTDPPATPARAPDAGVDTVTNDAVAAADAAPASDAAIEVQADGAAEAAAPADPLWVRTPAAGLALVNGDRKSTSIALLALGATAVATDACFGSGSANPQLSAALSGDVTLPSEPQPRNELVVIDRSNSVLTWINPTNCQVLRQLNVGTGFAANPHDLAAGLGGSKGYVTRYARNSAKPGEGSDLLIIDTDKATITGRIDLTAHAAPVAGKTIVPMPSRTAVVGRRVYVALNNLSEAYDAAGAGRVLGIDATTDAVVETIELPTLKNCGAITKLDLAGGGAALAVSCGGPYSDKDKQIDSAGVAFIDLSRSPPEVKVIASQVFGRPLSGFDLQVVDPAFAFTVVNGDGAMVNDAVWMFDVGGGAAKKLFDAGGSYQVTMGVDRSRRTLYLLDAAPMTPKVHLYSVPTSGAPSKSGELVASPKTGLPPRHLAFY